MGEDPLKVSEQEGDVVQVTCLGDDSASTVQNRGKHGGRRASPLPTSASLCLDGQHQGSWQRPGEMA